MKKQAAGQKVALKTAKKNEVLDEEGVVVVHVKFKNVAAGASLCKVTHNGKNPKTLQKSGKVEHSGVQMGDTIEVEGISAGTTTITVSGANTTPVKMNFVPGLSINGYFSIKA